jgi:hypothetical protein
LAKATLGVKTQRPVAHYRLYCVDARDNNLTLRPRNWVTLVIRGLEEAVGIHALIVRQQVVHLGTQAGVARASFLEILLTFTLGTLESSFEHPLNLPPALGG